MRDKHAEFDIWLEDHIEKSKDATISVFNAAYDIEWGEDKTKLVAEFRKTYPNDYYYYFATFFVPLDQASEELAFEIDVEDDDFPQFKEDFFI